MRRDLAGPKAAPAADPAVRHGRAVARAGVAAADSGAAAVSKGAAGGNGVDAADVAERTSTASAAGGTRGRG